jgi:hypothetical protein
VSGPGYEVTEKNAPAASRNSMGLAFFATIDSVGNIVCTLASGPAVRIEYPPHSRLSTHVVLEKIEDRVALDNSLHCGQENNFNRCIVERRSKLR